jgi:hypothetical protein
MQKSNWREPKNASGAYLWHPRFGNEGDAMKLILCTLAAFLVVGVLMIHPADAACWWNGYGWECWRPWHYAHWGYWHPYYHGGWGSHYWHHW